jgi:hypothetical protein
MRLYTVEKSISDVLARNQGIYDRKVQCHLGHFCLRFRSQATAASPPRFVGVSLRGTVTFEEAACSQLHVQGGGKLQTPLKFFSEDSPEHHGPSPSKYGKSASSLFHVAVATLQSVGLRCNAADQ